MITPNRTRDKLVSVEEGASYRGQQIGTRIETANVIRIQSDSLGIPHVHYELWVERSGVTPSVATHISTRELS